MPVITLSITTQQYPLPAIGGPQYAYFEQLEREYKTYMTEFEDGGADYNIPSPHPIRRWSIEYDHLTPEEAAILDDHNDSVFNKTLGFTLVDPRTNTTYNNVHYEEYKVVKHKKIWLLGRSVKLIKRP